MVRVDAVMVMCYNESDVVCDETDMVYNNSDMVGNEIDALHYVGDAIYDLQGHCNN